MLSWYWEQWQMSHAHSGERKIYICMYVVHGSPPCIGVFIDIFALYTKLRMAYGRQCASRTNRRYHDAKGRRLEIMYWIQTASVQILFNSKYNIYKYYMHRHFYFLCHLFFFFCYSILGSSEFDI